MTKTKHRRMHLRFQMFSLTATAMMLIVSPWHVNAYTQSMWCIACIFNIIAPGETLM